MRVLHWYPGFLSGGGAANAVLRLADAQAGAGIEAAIASVVADGMYGTPAPGERVDLVSWRPRWTIGRGGVLLRGLPRAAVEALRAWRPDVVHVHGEFNPDNWWVPRLFDCPVVLSPQGAFHPVVLSNSTSRAKSLYVRVAQRLLYRRLSALHAVTPMEERRLTELFPDTPVYCLPQGPSIDVADGEAARGGSGFVFVGRLDPFTKGLDILVDAFAAALPSLSGRAAALTLAGPDWRGGRRVVEQRARASGVRDRIRLPGAVASGDVPGLLGRFDCYVQLSRHESFGFGVADALTIGLPVIMTDGMGIASIAEVADQPHVRVVAPEPAAAAAALVDFGGRLDELQTEARSARGRVSDVLSWARIAELHRDHYGRLVPP